MVPDIPADDLCGDRVPDGPHKIAVLPELTSPELATQARETRKEFPGRDAFEDLDHPGGGIPWRCREKQMDMVFHHLHRVNLHIIGFRNLVKEILYSLRDLSDEHSLAVLGCPNNVILQVINGMGACFVGHTEIVAALRAARFPPHSKLWGTQRDFSWSHAGLHATFANALTRRRKHFAPALARDLPIVQELRHTADYRNQHLSARQANRALSKARAFVQAITRSLSHG